MIIELVYCFSSDIKDNMTYTSIISQFYKNDVLRIICSFYHVYTSHVLNKQKCHICKAPLFAKEIIVYTELQMRNYYKFLYYLFVKYNGLAEVTKEIICVS